MFSKVYLGFIALAVFLLVSCNSPEVSDNYKVLIDESWAQVDPQGKRININNALNEFLDRLEEENNILIQRQFTTYDDVVFSLNSGKCDAAFLGRDIDHPPYGVYDYSDPFILLGPVLVIPYSIKAKSIDEMSNRLIGVQERSSASKVLFAKPKIFSKHYEHIKRALEDAAKGDLQGILLGNLLAEAYCSGIYQKQLHVVGDILTEEGIRAFILKGGSEKSRGLLRLINEGIDKNILGELFEKWGIRKKKVVQHEG